MKKRLTTQFAIMLSLQLAMASSAHSDQHSEHAHEEKRDTTEDSQDRIQHGSHEHGAARLTVAITDQGLEIMLESPAANLFGFEHKADDKEEQDIVHKVEEKLEAGDALFVMNDAAKCQLTNFEIESDMIASHDEHGDEHKGGHETDQDDNHGADKHEDEHHEDEHKDDHDKHQEEASKGKEDDHDSHDHEKEGTHSDVDAAWAFTCENPADLKSVDTKLFSQFPKGFEQLNVEWISNDGAGILKLESDGMIKFSQ